MGQKPTEEEIFKMINEVDHSNRGVIGIRHTACHISHHIFKNSEIF